MRFPSLIACLLITSALSPLAAQQPSPTPSTKTSEATPQKSDDEDVVRITTNLVQVDAVVTDRNGKLVNDLKADEIEIYEDGKKQQITNFQYYVADSTPAEKLTKTDPRKAEDKNGPPVPPTILKPQDVRRTIALVVDDLGLSFESTHFVREAVKKFIDRHMQQGDLVAIVRSSSGMGALQQFTSDKRQLSAAVERIRWNNIGRGGLSAIPPFDGGPIAASPNVNDPSYIPGEDVERYREDVFSVGTLGAISYVVRGLRELPGRKSVVLVSDGFRLFSREDLGRSGRVYAAVRSLIDQANRASVVIYTIDARGLQTLGFTAADNTRGLRPDQVANLLAMRSRSFSDSQEGLSVLAEQTGGFSVHNNNDISGGIRHALDDQKGYYLIGFRPDESTFDRRRGQRIFHRLSLKVTRPGKFNVRMRSGFFGISDEDQKRRAPGIAQQMVGALASPFGATGVRLQLTSLFVNNEKIGSFMRSVVHIDARDLSFTNETNGLHKSSIDVLAMTFGDNGFPIEHAGKTISLELTDKDYKRSQQEGLIYYMTVPVQKPGAYQLRMSLRDSASGRIGSASQFVEIPDLKKKRLALSGLTVMGWRPGSGAPDNSISRAGQSDEGVDTRDPEASPAVRRFRSGMLLDYAFHVYNARLDKASNLPSVTTQIRLFRDGKEIFAGQTNRLDPTGQADLKRMVGSGRIQLGSVLAPGEYVAQVVVTDLLADSKHGIATQWIDFEIVE